MESPQIPGPSHLSPSQTQVLLEHPQLIENEEQQCSSTPLLEQRVSALEKSLKFRCDGLSKEIKLVLAELNIITDWISSRFDVDLIDKKSAIIKTILDLDQIEELSKSLSLLSKVPVKDLIGGRRQSSSGSGSGGTPTTKVTTGRRRGRPPGSGNKNSALNKSSQNKSIFKGALGTWIDSKATDKLITPTGFLDIKEEQEDFLHEDPFEDGYIPELDDEDNCENNAQAMEGSRPKRSSTRNVSYDGFMDSEEEDEEDEIPLPIVKRSQRGRPRRVDRSEDKDREYTSTSPTKEPKLKGQRKKYKPSEASAMRAKILANTPMMCDECGKVVKGPWTLKAHKEMHANIRRYTCHVCGYAFRRKPHLNAHLLLHEGVKSLKCQYCGRGFYLRRDLARHERTHTGERPYSCNFPNCPKSFNVKQHLTMHYRTHTGERPYKCNVCEKTFSQANTLRIHRKLHEGSNTSPRRRPRQPKQNSPQVPLQNSANIATSNNANSITTSSNNPIENLTSSVVAASLSSSILNENAHPSSTCSTPVPPSSVNSQQDFRSPIDTHSMHSQSPFSDSRQGISNAHPFDMINHSWRQGLGQQSGGIGNPAGLFLPQMYEPLNMHYGSYNNPNN